MKSKITNIIALLSMLVLMCVAVPVSGAAPKAKTDSAANAQPAVAAAQSSADSLAAAPDSADADMAAPLSAEEFDDGEAPTPGFHQVLKTKFIEGDAAFMSLVALALVIGLAFCIERIVYLSLSEINTRTFMSQLDALVSAGDIEGAKALCRDTRGPVASICYQGLLRSAEPIDDIERSIASYGTVQAANLERGCSWITLFIAMAPSLGFLGTVIGMVMAFEQIQAVGDINPTIVAAGMKVALITTIFGIIVALILQLFYNYILVKIDRLTAQMEECAITLLDSIVKLKREGSNNQ